VRLGGGRGAATRRVVLGGLGRRRAQTAVLVLTVLTAVTASVLATGLLVGSRAPFDRAFGRQHGAHLTVEADATKATGTELAATARLAGVTAAAGPFRTATVDTRTLGIPGEPDLTGPRAGPVDLPPLAVVGRDDPGGSVDRVDLVEGAWPTRAGEIVLSTGLDFIVPVGTRVSVQDPPGGGDLTVVGIARSASRTADAWVAAAEVPRLAAAGGETGYQMLYRFAAARTDADLRADRAAVEGALPPDALTGARSYLDIRRDATARTAVYVPFVAAFGGLGLAMSALIIGIVVSGAVGSARWRIGVLRSLGFTPGQVVAAYVGQTLVPATVGVGAGVLLGHLLSVPVLADQSDANGGPKPSIPLWVDLAVAAGALALVAGAAVVSASRAGRMPAVEAISLGRAPRPGRGRLARHLIGRLPVARPVSLGLANPFARPARAAVMAAAVGLGALGVTFAVGLGTTLALIQQENAPDLAGDVVVNLSGGEHHARPGEAGPAAPGEAAPGQRAPGQRAPGEGAGPATAPAPEAADTRAVAAAISALPGTARSYGTAGAQVAVRGMAGTADVTALTGDVSAAARRLAAGRWLDAPGEAVVDTRLLRATGLRLGDRLTVTDGGHVASLLLVGEVFEVDDTPGLVTASVSLAGLGLDLTPNEFGVDLKPGTDVAAYLHAADDALASLGASAQRNEGGESTVIVAMISLITTLTLMIVAVAVLGVLNTVVLDTRERVHDLGVFKALGMAPRQTVAMVVTSVAGIGAVAGLVGVPLGILLHHAVVPLMGDAVCARMPAAYLDVYDPLPLAGLALGGLLIAAIGALPPASWAAATRTATALRTE